MAIFGDLADFSIHEVLGVIRSKTGVLYMGTAFGGRSLEIGVHSNHMLYMFVDGFPVQEKERAAHILGVVTREAYGPFEFRNKVLEDLSRSFLVPMYPIVQRAAEAQDVSDAQLPHPQTRFKMVEHAGPLPTALQATWPLVGVHLSRGVSSDELAEAVQMDQREARLMIYRYRSAGLLELYAGQLPASAAGAEAGEVRETFSVVRRLLLRLRGRVAT